MAHTPPSDDKLAGALNVRSLQARTRFRAAFVVALGRFERLCNTRLACSGHVSLEDLLAADQAEIFIKHHTQGSRPNPEFVRV